MLELYQAEDCPYSENVREKLMELGVSYVIHNPRTAGGMTRNQQTLDELETLGGRKSRRDFRAHQKPTASEDGEDQIPFLVDHQHGIQLYESEDIIEHLAEHYA